MYFYSARQLIKLVFLVITTFFHVIKYILRTTKSSETLLLVYCDLICVSCEIMRRGHPGIGGWRSENPRHFRPRGSGPPRFRPPRIYPLLESPRFPPPSPHLHHRGPQPFIANAGRPEDHGRQDHHERHKYRDGHHQINQRMPDRGHHPQSRQIFPYIHHNMRQKDHNQRSPYKDSTNFYEDLQVDPCRINSMGDIDHRQATHMSHTQDSYNQQRISPWSNPPPEIKKHYYEDRSPQKSFRHHDAVEGSRIPVVDYTGHRPPSSDHYGGTSGPTTNNNNTSFSRSVDDTVDIIRKRLMNRNDPQRLSQDTSTHQSVNSEQEVSENTNQHIQQEQPAKKRTPRQRQNVKSNCDKMKTNIVHQLFKMDKDKMHKLMDDPGSSSKFEYAISSLITESQNSLNRHLRSVAEKSLYSSGTDFIHNDNNTIYEDTFMKQMQCLLDPQDTVLLEDIKPIVMAELSKVLQLADFEQRFDMPDEHNAHHARDDQSNYPYFEPSNFDEYPQEISYEQNQSLSSNYENSNSIEATDGIDKSFNYDHEPEYEETKPLFERRQSRRSDRSQDRRNSIESQRQRRSIDKPVEEMFKSQEEPLPLFDTTNTDQLSEDEDTFAELDRQYHVAVDHNFIENDDLSTRGTPPKLQPVQTESVKNEKDNKLPTFAQSPLKLFSLSSSDSLRELAIQIKREVTQSPDFLIENTTPRSSDNSTHRVEHIEMKQEFVPKPKDNDKETEKSGSSNIMKTSESNSRKRSIEQRPSHRKEKRKKSESSQPDSSKPTLDKKVITDVNTDTAKSAEKCNDAPKPYYNILLNKDESTKEAKDKKDNTTDKSYSDKYVKRKDPSKKPKESESREREARRKRHSSSSSQSILSPKDSINTRGQTPTKSDPKTKLKTFDMFVEQPKKSSLHHHAHRNTASAITPTKPTVEENKSKQVPTPPHNKIVQLKHVGTQVIKRLITKETQTFLSKSCSTRFCQTDRKKFVTRCVQTIPVSFDNKTKPKSSDAFERMKEIDMEIQVLLQEKFKLYSSLESRDSCPSSMPTLGMTVLNVTPIDESKEVDDADTLADSADSIADDFTNIPVEELEQIALETVQEDSSDSVKVEKRTLRQKVLQQERKTSESPTSKRSNKKAKTPNISLIEQIITDDRPLEEIISLDDLEEPQSKNKKKKPHRTQPKKKITKRTKPVVKTIDVSSYDLKNCSVVLIQTDVKKFIKEQSPMSEDTSVTNDTPAPSSTDLPEPAPVEQIAKSEPTEDEEETVVNDLQFDMLDVSEDIVIGDNCEIKCNEDKDMHGRVAISEDIILDNSQSSADDAFSVEAGQVENECKTYDYSTDEKLRRDSVTVTGNADAVLAIECIENAFIAACLDGNVYHFSGDGQLLNTLRGSNLAVTCLTIVKEKYGTTVYTGSLDSRIRYYDLETGLEKGPECNVLSPIQTMDRAWDTVFVGTRTGFVLQFECKNNMLIPVSTVKFSEQSILALRAMKEGPRKVLLVAARSENVTIKDAQTGLLLRTLSGPKMTVYTLLFEDGKVFCGTSSHQIHVFDYASGMHTGCHEGGKGAVCLRATGGLLFAGCYDGCVYVYREGETRPLAQLRGPSLMLLSLAVVGSKIIAGYKDRSLYIWKIPLSILQEMIL